MKLSRFLICYGALICLVSSATGVALADGTGPSVRRVVLSPATDTASSSPPRAETVTAISEHEWGELDKVATGRSSRVLAGAWGAVSVVIESATSYMEFAEQWQALSQADREVDVDPRNFPQLPSSCVGRPSSECQCFDRAYRALQDNRGILERLRVMGLSTRRMVDSSVAFGDSLSGGTGTGLGWFPARRGILQSLQDFEQTYDAKHAELVGKLHDTLQEIAACEAELGERDWYRRVGFIYYELMKERYRGPGH